MLPDKICYTCLSKERGDLIDLQKSDIDKTSYKQKLLTCLSNNLEEFTSMKMCRPCIKLLRVSYNFLKMVKSTQESIKQYSKHEIVTNDKHNIKHEISNEKSNGNNKNLGQKDDIYESDNDYFLLELKHDTTDISSFSCNLCNKHEMNSSEYMEHTCDTKEDLRYKSENSNDEQFCDSDRNREEDKAEKVTKKVKNKPSECNAGFSYECQYCEQIFTKRWQLTKHISRIHSQEKKFVCTYCHKAFKESYHLREHVTMHTGERNYACTICDKTFLRASSQRRHIKSHEAPPGQKTKRTPFLCTICGKSFPFSNGVQRHMRIHFGIKKHECQLCKRKFMQSTHLYVHMRTHTGEKPYICDICGEAFSLNCSLQKHMTIHKSTEIKIEDKNELLIGNITF